MTIRQSLSLFALKAIDRFFDLIPIPPTDWVIFSEGEYFVRPNKGRAEFSEDLSKALFLTKKEATHILIDMERFNHYSPYDPAITRSLYGIPGLIPIEKPDLIVFYHHSGLQNDHDRQLGKVAAVRIGSYEKPNYRPIFELLEKEWLRSIPPSSRMEDITTKLRPYRDVIAIGKPILPFIFASIKKDPDWWFEALRQITGEDPVKDENRGNLAKMTADWLAWADAKGIKYE